MKYANHREFFESLTNDQKIYLLENYILDFSFTKEELDFGKSVVVNSKELHPHPYPVYEIL